MQLPENEEIHERLSVLEEVASNIKQAFPRAMHERKSIIDKVYHYFQNIDGSLQIQDQSSKVNSPFASFAARPSVL